MMPERAPDSASVLLAFRGENVRSFRDEFVLSVVATTVAEPDVRRSVHWREGGSTIDVLPVAGLFGANASGKSNALRAMADMRDLVLGSFRRGTPTGGLPQRPFRLDPEAVNRPSRFEIDLVLDGVRHQYGFTFDREQVIDEWAVHFPKGRSVLLFSRKGLEVELGARERARGRAATELLRPNALFLSTAASANHPLLLPLYGWFERNLLLAEAQSRDRRQLITARMLDDPKHSLKVLEFLRAADLGIEGAKTKELDPKLRERLERVMQVLLEDEIAAAEAPIDEMLVNPSLLHRGVSGEIEFEMAEESLGTLVWFGIVGPVVRVLSDGAVFLADELDASLHPVLVAHLVALFQDAETNPRRAQLVFNSHDTTLLGDSAMERLEGGPGRRLLGRDQIWFTEKANDGATRLYPLSDLAPRKDEATERRYLAGRYGAVPIVSRVHLDAAGRESSNGLPKG